jgi:DNA end-binding protein Ku
MLWPDEVREADFDFVSSDVDVRPQELQMAGSLIDSMSGDFDPADYSDAYREALQAVIDAKVEGKEIVAPAAEEAPPAAADLLSALRASVEAAKKDRGASAKGGGSAKDGSAKDGSASGSGETKPVKKSAVKKSA